MNAPQATMREHVLVPAEDPGMPAHSVRFLLLGPLEVLDGRRNWTPRANKLRVLLAILLVRGNTVVSTDTLISELWGDKPPRTAMKALRVYVSQLRRIFDALTASGPPVIVTRDPGYRLEIDDDSLDANQFERLCERGRAACDGGDMERALRHYREAAGMWKGSALVDVRSSPLLEAAALRLEESRIFALERRIDLELRLGGHAEAISELRALVREHPLNERIHAQLMVALSLAGRRKDALEAYRGLRGAFVEDLGVEPSRDLKLLHQEILEADDRAPLRWESWAR
ncbi:AfsR/SARP family transcriptional regulator [Actinomadura alba]|uniref:AfsR/SARP family transcriptional regulator n=1 Tax=Actinomadura alba TaxID=406431 RepID=A0ABR7LU62_9ACTN|nr:AfsR/SARP family transcriptional regulator [Actinomadura alba]MBC6468380.1 AfsR/SARP family transcriptional regulator [Actinomadura alba]